MLKKYRIFLIIISCFAMFTSCDKEYSVENSIPGGGTGGGGAAVQGSFRAKIDGVQWTANSKAFAQKIGGVIALRGSSSDGKLIYLNVKDSGVHNYQFTNTSSTNFANYTDSSLAPLGSPFSTDQWIVDSTYGYLNVTTIDDVRKTMSGTFRIYVMRNLDGLKRNITEGVFTNISYGTPTTPPTNPPVNPPAGTDYFKVKIDGVDFIKTSFEGVSSNGFIVFSATNAASVSIDITVPDNITPGSYQVSLGGAVSAEYFGTTTYLMGETGTVIITEHNTTTRRITATFSFLGMDFATGGPSSNFTQGSFSGVYQ